MSVDDLRARLGLVHDVLARTADPFDEPFRLTFQPQSGEDHLESWRAHAAATHAPFVLYVHIPFCARVCSYCLLAARPVGPRAFTDAYVTALRREIALFAAATGPRRASALHLGGGTPSLLDVGQLDALLGDLEQFARAPGFRIGFECHPRTTTRDKLEVLARRGVGRISLGVETFTPEVLRAVDRADQRPEDVRRAVAEAKRCGLAVNIDLLAGLPGETEASFAASVRAALALGVDSMSVNRTIAENSSLAESGWSPDQADVRRAGAMLLAADRIIHEERPPRWPDRPLEEAGYGAQYVWDAVEDRPYVQEDMIGPASTLALGHGGMGKVFGERFWTGAGDPTTYVRTLEAGRAPDVLAAEITPRFEMAFHVADRAARGQLESEPFAATFGASLDTVFGHELGFLRGEGLLTRSTKPRSLSFQALHLLAFLCFTTDELRARLPAAPAAGTAGIARAREYAVVGAELPPSLLWCRIAMRAARASGSAAGLTVRARPPTARSPMD